MDGPRFIRVHVWLERLSRTWWSIPTFMTLLGVLLAAGSLLIDFSWPLAGESWASLLLESGVDSVQPLLSTIAGSMITVAGVTFSITIVVLTLASSQFGPRLIRVHITDRSSQFVLGIFIATFLYCVIVLKAARTAEGDFQFIPNISLLVALLLAVLSIGGFIFFVHRVTSSIQASRIIDRALGDLEGVIERFTEELGEDEDEDEDGDRERVDRSIDDAALEPTRALAAYRDGYAQSLDYERMRSLVMDQETRIRVLVKPGDYVIEGQTIAVVRDPGPERSSELEREFERMYTIGSQRTPVQDIDFAIQQFIEISIRSLSPGINDPFTAINAVDVLSGPLVRLTRRRFLPRGWCDEDGEVVLEIATSDWDEIVTRAFEHLFLHARKEPRVVGRMDAALERMEAACRNDERRAVIARLREGIRAAGMA